ncbi:MAG: HNH endonuclease [Ignavibacteriae bacterium]|nr:HNH endonuclease [Ignavibacteriota bacterium]
MSNKETKLKTPHEIDLEVWKRDKWTCQYCGYRAVDFKTWWNGHFSIDHIKPRGKSWNGKHELENLALTCGQCNTYKGSHYEAEWDLLDRKSKLEKIRLFLSWKIETQHSKWFKKHVENNLNFSEEIPFLFNVPSENMLSL